MEISPLRLALLLFYSFVFGMAMGVFYDLHRIIRVFFGVRYSGTRFEKIENIKLPIVKKRINFGQRKVSKISQNTIVFFGDFASVVAATMGIIILNYSYNSGKFRLFTVLGVFFGFLLYHFTLGRLVMTVSEPAAMLIKYVFLSFFILFLYPFYMAGKFISKKIAKCFFLYTFAIEKKQKRVYNIKEEVYLEKMSKNGFLPSDIIDRKDV